MHRIGRRVESHQQFRQSIQLAALAEMLSDQDIEIICGALGHSWRRRELPPGVTVRSMVYRALSADRCITAVVDDLVANGDVSAGLTNSAWCQARCRLPQPVWVYLLRGKARGLRRLAGADHLWFGRPVFRVDGSTLSMPDEPQLVKAFGYAPGKYGPSRFPVARITFIVLAGVEALWDYRLDGYLTSEDAQFHDMWQSLPSGCICVFDRYFCTFYNLAKSRQRRIGAVSRLHQRRDPQQLIRQGRQIGRNEWIVPLKLSPQLRRKYDDPTLPQTLYVRLIRVPIRRGKKRKNLWLVTTLMDPIRYPRRQIAMLYRGRWGVETRIGSVKVTLALTVLRSKTEANIRKEVAAALVAHNLVWMLIHQAAQQTGTPADRISFARTIGTVMAFSAPLRYCGPEHHEELYERMLARIAAHTNPYRPNRVEPRKIKRDPVRYPYLKIPRQQARLECLS